MHDRPARPTAFCWNQKYPRICGEKQRTLAIQDEPQGSPPRMRGKGQAWMKEGDSERITPAYAGKSTPTRHQKATWCGSPLHMRGKDEYRRAAGPNLGITPAYAGKSIGGNRWDAINWDHPRICGEKVHGDEQAMAKLGSPPRMRGKEDFPLQAYANSRITPAYAGKSLLPYCLYRSVWDHPRVCGEKTKKIP